MRNPDTPKADGLPSTFSAYFSALRENIEQLRSHLLYQIKDFAESDRDTDWLVTCTKALQAVEKQIESLASSEAVLVQISESVAGLEPGREQKTERGLRRIIIEISEGMVNQSLLSLTAARKRKTVSLGERLKIVLPDGTRFESEIVEPGNRLRERGLIRAFFQSAKVRPGEEVVLEEVTPGEWTLKKVELDPSLLAAVASL